MRYQDMDAWSQAMIDGIANYTGNKEVEARCNAATSGIDAAIDDMIPVVTKHPNTSILSVLLAAGQPMESIRGQCEACDLRRRERAARCDLRRGVGAAHHPEAARAAHERQGESGSTCSRNMRAGIAPIGMSPRRVAKPCSYGGVDFEENDRVFFMFGSANRDEACFADPDRFDLSPRHLQEASPSAPARNYCAGAFASRAMVADVALPSLFARLKNLRLDPSGAGQDRRLGLQRPAQSAGRMGRVAVSPADLRSQTFACIASIKTSAIAAIHSAVSARSSAGPKAVSTAQDACGSSVGLTGTTSSTSSRSAPIETASTTTLSQNIFQPAFMTVPRVRPRSFMTPRALVAIDVDQAPGKRQGAIKAVMNRLL